MIQNGCQGSTDPQTEFEFFQQLLHNHGILVCCGPITQIGFTGPSLTAFNAGLAHMGLSPGYLDLYAHEVLDSGHLSYFMCARHWIHHARSLGAIAKASDNKAWEDLAIHLFRVTCLTNEWDYKEILNFVGTAEQIRTKKED